MSPDYRTNHFWPLTHLRVTGTDRALCGRLPGNELLVGRWDDFTCPTCRDCSAMCPRCGRVPDEVCLIWECEPTNG